MPFPIEPANTFAEDFRLGRRVHRTEMRHSANENLEKETPFPILELMDSDTEEQEGP